MAIKSIPKEKVEILIKEIEESNILIDKLANSGHFYAHSQAFGAAETTIKHILRQLKGEYPIL